MELAEAWRAKRALRKQKLIVRARMVSAIRAFFIGRGFLEVETPARCPCPLPEANIDPIESAGQWLLPSPEAGMKRLLAAGYGPIFQISRVFREGERGRLHLPEFTMLEWYRPDADYNDLMRDCTQLLRAVAEELGLGKLTYQGKDIDIGGDFARVAVGDAYRDFCGISPEKALAEGTFDELMAGEIEPRLGLNRPAFLVDYPAKLGSLAKLCDADPRVAERVELYIAGLELANGFTELTDPAEQRRRFTEEAKLRQAYGKPPMPMPEGFLSDLAHLPKSAGMALGIDRLAMIFTDSTTIDEVTALLPEEW